MAVIPADLSEIHHGYIRYISIKHEDKYRFKRQVLARFNCCTVDEARIYKARFLDLNRSLTADEVNGEWVVREFI